MPPSTHITVSVHSQTHTSKATYHASPKCLKYASFMHGLSPGWALFLAILFGLLAVLFTNAVRWSTPGVCNKPKKVAEAPVPDAGSDSGTIPSPQTTGLENAEAGALVNGDRVAEGEAPPPYQPPILSSTTVSTLTQPQPQITATTQTHTWMIPKSPEVKTTSAHRFVTGSFFFALTLTSFVLSGLSIQTVMLCNPDGEFGTVAKVFFWLLFAIPLAWSTTALSCFLILLRNLWGPSMEHRFPLDQSSVIMGLVIALMFPFIFVGYILGGAAVWAVQRCQRVCCGVGGEEDADGDDAQQGGVELEEGRAGVVSRDSEELGGDDGEEERVALMGKGKSDV
ncbi:hypothetical protein BKA65DRAFT_165625 [Rhexocercosporidium sp. MPI-PUGE-AT-0058]|nr:hypothetical protein BKA65DRAFT_165625 [Rhexocercosporidium sp. MPI-PUGE-AT-0058]